MIDGQNFFNQPVKNDLRTYDTEEDDYTTGCSLDCPYFKENYNQIAIDLSKQQALDADLKAIQQINFTENLDPVANTTIFFVTEEAKEIILYISQ